ncbi:MAG: dockerin type I repeat-containing protein [Oscillospiraceae bacterium]|nr:dockerin type I repeat-containing protein [Oscillospiraceae bacterium]
MKKKMKRAIACLLSLAMLTGSIVTGTVAADTTAETETIAIDAEAEFLPVAVYVQLSAEHAAQLDAFRQEYEAFRDEKEAGLVPLSEEENEAYDRFVKGEISQEEYTAISKKNQPLIDAIADQVGEAYFKFNADARNLAESEAADRMAEWGISGLNFTNVYTDSASYCLSGEVTAVQAEMLRNDPAVTAVEEFEPLELPPAEPDTAEPITIETDTFSYTCYTPLSNIRNYIDERDELSIPDTKANLMVTGAFQDKTSGRIVYTAIELNSKAGAYRGRILYWDNVPGNVPLHAGDLLNLTGYSPIEPYPPVYPCGEDTQFEVIGNGCDLLGEEFEEVIEHEKRLAGYYALGAGLENYTEYYTPVEEEAKNWDYYWNLDDYAVYKDYVRTHGKPFTDGEMQFVPEDTLPAETELPWYENMHYYVTNDTYFDGITYWVDEKLTDQDVIEMAETPSYFGFPDAWHLDKYEMLYDDGDSGAYMDVGCHVVRPFGASHCGSISLRFDQLKNIGVQEIPVIRSVVDLYRIQLTLEHSQFAQEHVRINSYGYDFRFDPPYGTTDAYYSFGDPSGDGVVNASDAAAVLIEAAAVGAGMETGFTETQLSAADVNRDGTVNASDAAVVLVYASAVGSGDRYAKISDFVKT